MQIEDLMYFNGFGGFSKDGKEYIIKVNKMKKHHYLGRIF